MCVSFPQITQKILTKDIFHRPELITEILGFLQIFSARKATTQFFLIFQNFCKNINRKIFHFWYISGMFWSFKSKLLTIHAATYIALFLPDSNNCFLYVQCHIYIFVCTFFSFHVLIFYNSYYEYILSMNYCNRFV